MSASDILIGTTAPGRRECARRCLAWNAVGRVSHENDHDQPRSTVGAVLHPTAHAATAGQPAYDQFVSRYLPPLAEVRATAVAHAAGATNVRGHRCPVDRGVSR